MKKLYRKIRLAFVMFFWAFTHESLDSEHYLKMMGTLLELILKVMNEQRPMMTKIAQIHPENEETQNIATIWVGAGIASDPTDRIEQLLEENALLKKELGQYVGKSQNEVIAKLEKEFNFIKPIENVWVVVDRNNQIMRKTEWYNEKDAKQVAKNIKQHVPMFKEFADAMPVTVENVNIEFTKVRR